MQLKQLVLAISATSVIGLSVSHAANETKGEVTKTSIPDAGSGDTTTAKTPKPSNQVSIVQPSMPLNSAGRYATSRFGLWRNWVKEKRVNFHKGMDMVAQDHSILATDTSVITKHGGGKQNGVTMRRSNGDYFTVLHGVVGTVTKGNIAQAGKHVVQMGSSGTKSVHLHYEYGVPCDLSRSWIVAITGNTERESLNGDKVIRTWAHQDGSAALPAKICFTDPTPYFKEDITLSTQDKGLRAYLGNTIRQQYNVLYRSNLSPLAAGASKITADFADLPVIKGLTKDELANTNMNAINATSYADIGGYSIGGETVSQPMIASIFSTSDGNGWDSLPKPAKTESIKEQSPKQIVQDIQEKRFGNPQWDAAVVKLSSKGALDEYLMMEAESNYLTQQNSRIKRRIEGLLAGLTQAQLFELNKKLEAMSATANADSIPQIIDVELKQMEGYAGGGVGAPPDYGDANIDWGSVNKDDLQQVVNFMFNIIAKYEGDYNAFNYGSSPCDGFTGKRAIAEDRALRRKHITEDTVGNLVANAKKKGDNCASRKRSAHGKFQFTENSVTHTFRLYSNFLGSSTYTSIYNPREQERSARWLAFKGQGSQTADFILGHGTFGKAMSQLSAIWASVPCYATDGSLSSLGYNNKGKKVRPIARGASCYGSGNSAHNKELAPVAKAIADWHQKFGASKKVTINEDLSISVTDK